MELELQFCMYILKNLTNAEQGNLNFFLYFQSIAIVRDLMNLIRYERVNKSLIL